MADAPTSSGDLPPPPAPPPAQPESGSISSMVASSASSAAAAATDFTRWAETFGTEKADAAKAALASAATLATSSASAAASASSTAASSAYAAASDLTLVAKEELEWVKMEYSVHEQMVFGKIKEGVVMAITHPGIAAGSATLAGIVLFKRPRSYLIQRVRRMFVSKETLLSGIEAEVNHMRQTVNLVSNESQKLMDRAATAEKRDISCFIREEGRAIQNELNEISDIEKQALGLKDILDQLPRAHASEFRSEVSKSACVLGPGSKLIAEIVFHFLQISGLASQVKKEKRVLNVALSKIVNYGVPI
ncbi:hypothetical protein BAE44_0010605 [Dichanthelium oligosanthes]|uniref:Uncharacterized protein n=1 Tax=Dichanthelium oligosanthes TaxID=888268 RepID=A0A1E5VTD1_9POAL|nr:hypothetical protein BAE44_0010605 [Dichanthelium oligosanthes]